MNFDSKSFKVKNERGIYIKKLNGNEWCEIENGKVTKNLEYLGRLDDHIVLFNRADGNVIKVYSNCVKHSRSWYLCLHEGEWIYQNKSIECINLIQIILRIGIFLSQMIGLVLMNFIFDEKCQDCLEKYKHFNIIPFILIAGLGALFSAFIFIIDLIYWFVISKTTESNKQIVIVFKTLIIDILWIVGFITWICLNSKLIRVHQMDNTDKDLIKRDYLIIIIVFAFIATVLSVASLVICVYRLIKCIQKINEAINNR